MKRILTVISIMLSFFIFLGASFVSMKVEAAYGETGSWTGNLNFYGARTNAYLTYKNDFSYSYNSSSGDITSDSYYALYEMNMPVRLTVTDLTPGYIYVGRAEQRGSFQLESTGIPVSATLYESAEISISSVRCDEGLTVDCVYYTAANPTIMTFGVSFDNYCAHDTKSIIDVTLKIRFRVLNNANSNYVGQVIVAPSNGTDTAGFVNYYTDLRDTPGIDGYFANQNQDIISSIDDNTSAIDDMSSYIGNQIKYYSELLGSTISSEFDQLINNLTSWYNGLTKTINDGIDKLLTSYTGTGTTDAANKFDDSAGELETVETDLTGITNSSIDNYSTAAFDTGIISSLGPSLVYVVTWFTNFWNMGGIFTSLLNVGLALFVAFFILRLHGGSK